MFREVRINLAYMASCVEVERVARFALGREKGERIHMRFMISARCPNEKLNALLKEGRFPRPSSP